LELDDIEMRHERVSSLSSIGVRKSKMFASTRLWQNCRLVLPANANLSSLQAGQKLKLNRTPLVPPKRNGKRCNGKTKNCMTKWQAPILLRWPNSKKQLHASNERLQRLEMESTVAEDVIRSYSSSVGLLHVTVGFRDKLSGLTLRYTTLTPPSSPDASDQIQVQLGGIGAEVHMDAFGTGFLVSSDGLIVTNHHVVEPWWKNEDIGKLLTQVPNVEPFVAEMTAYFPGIPRGIPLKLQKISSGADVALVAGNVSGLKLKLLTMDDDPKAAISGEPVVLIGYPTGIDAILARTSEDALRSIAANTNGDLTSVMGELARRKLIRPVNTQGHIGDVLEDKIVYDAQTTSGGSGGPLFNSAGKVIAVNVAMLRDFGGSNFAIPVRYAKRLLSE